MLIFRYLKWRFGVCEWQYMRMYQMKTSENNPTKRTVIQIKTVHLQMNGQGESVMSVY